MLAVLLIFHLQTSFQHVSDAYNKSFPIFYLITESLGVLELTETHLLITINKLFNMKISNHVIYNSKYPYFSLEEY